MQIDIQIPFSEFKIVFKREGFELVDGFFSNYGPPLLIHDWPWVIHVSNF